MIEFIVLPTVGSYSFTWNDLLF